MVTIENICLLVTLLLWISVLVRIRSICKGMDSASASMSKLQRRCDAITVRVEDVALTVGGMNESMQGKRSNSGNQKKRK